MAAVHRHEYVHRGRAVYGNAFFNPPRFLQVMGIIVVVAGILGLIGLLGPTAEQSVFGSAWWFDAVESWAWIIVGVVAIILGFAAPVVVQRPIVMVAGIILLLLGLFSLFGPIPEGVSFMGANLENPADTILLLVLGAWGLWSSMEKRYDRYERA